MPTDIGRAPANNDSKLVPLPEKSVISTPSPEASDSLPQYEANRSNNQEIGPIAAVASPAPRTVRRACNEHQEGGAHSGCDEALKLSEWIGVMLAADDELAREASRDDRFDLALREACSALEEGLSEQAETAVHVVLKRFNLIQNRAFLNRRRGEGLHV